MEDHCSMPTCAQNLTACLASYTDRLGEAYGDGLMGVYLYGSLARGCYHPSTSDVDIIVVIRDESATPDDSLILQLHRSAGVPMDTVFITESHLNVDIFPAHVAYLVKPVSDYRIVRQHEGSRDFLLQRQDAYEAGIAVAGLPPRDLIRPVPWPLLGESLEYLFPHIVPYFKNPVLMLCRIVYAWTNRRPCSKRDAGEWAITTLGEQWTPMITTALAEYASGSATSATREALHAFEAHCVGAIAEVRQLS